MLKSGILSPFFLITVFLIAAQNRASVNVSNEWKGLVPLVSKRSDVDKVLNKPLKEGCFDCTYQTSSEQVFVSYSKAVCKGGTINGWNVPKDTVISFTVYPRNRQKFSADDLNGRNLLYYSHDSFVLQEKGVAYTVERLTNSIERVSFMPTESDNHLRCAGYPAYNPAGSMYAPDLAFGETDALQYFDVLVTESSAKTAGTVIYAIVYAGRDMSDQKYRKVMKNYETHLYKKRRVSQERIQLIKGGKRDKFSVSVFYLNKDLPPPVPSPYYPSF